MPSGILGSADLAATTNTTVYTVPTLTLGTLNVSIVNRGTTTSKIRLALAATNTPTAAEYIEYDASLDVNQVLERTGLVVDAGRRVVAYSDTGLVSVVVYGLEEQ